MVSYFTEFQGAAIHYLFCDRGENVMVCFHGYDETAAAFEMLEDFLPAGYSLLAIDLPFHGETEWPEGAVFDAGAAWDIIEGICNKHAKRREQLIVSGFSLGGRVAFGFYEHNPSGVARLLLFAPDGIENNLWYRAVTGTIAGRRLFKFTVRYPGWLLAAIRLGRKLRVINQSVYKFTVHYLQVYSGRKKLYDRWMVTRKLCTSPSVLKAIINKEGTPLLLIYGSYDRIVPPAAGRRFCRDLRAPHSVEEIPCGHLILQPKNKKYLADIIEKQKTTTV